MKLFVTSDLLLGDDVELGRKRGSSRRILRQWEQIVFPHDLVVVLGNISMKGSAYWMGAIKSLPGNKVLLKGSYDPFPPHWYEKKGFDLCHNISYQFTVGDEDVSGLPGLVTFSAIPAFNGIISDESQSQYHGLIGKMSREFDLMSAFINVHGHTRGKGNERNNTLDASPEVTDFNLNTLEQHINRYKERIANASGKVDRSSSQGS